MSRSRKTVFERDTFELIWRAAVGLALFALVIIALAIKGQAQQIGAAKERSNAEELSTKDSKVERSDERTADSAVPQQPPSPTPQPQSPDSKWHFGGFIDAAYLLDFNHPENRVFRSRGTTWHTDRPHINGAAFYLRKKVEEQSRWGVELTAQAGKDVELFGLLKSSKYAASMNPPKCHLESGD